jgi:hypothetical protein
MDPTDPMVMFKSERMGGENESFNFILLYIFCPSWYKRCADSSLSR